MKLHEAYRIKADLLELIEGTALEWWHLVRDENGKHATYDFEIDSNLSFMNSATFAVIVYKNTPLFVGDTIYYKDEQVEVCDRCYAKRPSGFFTFIRDWNDVSLISSSVDYQIGASFFKSDFGEKYALVLIAPEGDKIMVAMVNIKTFVRHKDGIWIDNRKDSHGRYVINSKQYSDFFDNLEYIEDWR